MRIRRPAGTRRPSALAASIGVTVLTAVALSACGGGTPESAVSPTPGGANGADGATVATATRTLTVYSGPETTDITQTLPAALPTGTPEALLVTQSRGSRVEACSPTRPNGSRGWIDLDRVTLTHTNLSVDVSLRERHLRVTRGGADILDAPVAIGAPETPTPTGSFYLTELLSPATPDGPYGPFAFGLSAHSDVLTDFAGGDGTVGLHGTNAPDSIGKPVTHGCLRVNNVTVRTLATTLGLGTPITVRA